jgi:hypothetical protein
LPVIVLVSKLVLPGQLDHRAAHLHRTSRKDTGTVCGATHTCPPEGHTCPVPQVLGRDDVARSASAVPGGAGAAKLEAVRRLEAILASATNRRGHVRISIH